MSKRHNCYPKLQNVCCVKFQDLASIARSLTCRNFWGPEGCARMKRRGWAVSCPDRKGMRAESAFGIILESVGWRGPISQDTQRDKMISILPFERKEFVALSGTALDQGCNWVVSIISSPCSIPRSIDYSYEWLLSRSTWYLWEKI